MKIMNKKLLINIINISLTSFSVNALSLEASSNYYQDYDGVFIGYTTDPYFFPTWTEVGDRAQISRDDWNGFINTKGQIMTFRNYLDVDHTTNDFYYQTSDCTGTRYVKLKLYHYYHEDPFETEILKESPTTKKITQYTVTHEPFSMDNVGDDMFGDKGVSQSKIDENGKFICTKTHQQELRDQWDWAINLVENGPAEELEANREKVDYIIDTIPEEAMNNRLVLGKVSDDGIDMTNRYPWMGFDIEENHNVIGYIKAARFGHGIELILGETPPPVPPEELSFPRTSHNVTAHVRYTGDLSYVNITQGPDIFVSQITVNKESTGVYDISFPENYLSKKSSVNTFQVLCSVNSGADIYAANTTIGCHKLNNNNIIRVTTNYKGKPFDSDFSLNLQR